MRGVFLESVRLSLKTYCFEERRYARTVSHCDGSNILLAVDYILWLSSVDSK